MPFAAPAFATGPSCASTSVRRLRTARSRQMPLWVLAERRLKATRSSSEAAASAWLALAGRRRDRSRRTPPAARPRRRRHPRPRAPSASQQRRDARGDARQSAMRIVGQRRGEQQRAIGRACPTGSPRYSPSARARSSNSAGARAGARMRGVIRPSSSPMHHRASPADTAPRPGQVIGAEIDEGADGTLLAELRRDDLLVETVLDRDHATVSATKGAGLRRPPPYRAPWCTRKSCRTCHLSLACSSAGALTRKVSMGPTICNPSRAIAATWSAARSTNTTSSPARAR